jgi:hypothetical protein
MISVIYYKICPRRLQFKFKRSLSGLNLYMMEQENSLKHLTIVLDLDETLVHTTYIKPMFFDKYKCLKLLVTSKNQIV